MIKHPNATLVRSHPGATVWFVGYPNGKSYYVTTYPNSDLIFIETSAKRRPVSSLVARNISVSARKAIEAAKR